MKVPQRIHANLRSALWTLADEINWMSMSDPDKSRLYEEWVRSDKVGGVLSRYLDPEAIRVYIKDTLMKPYMRDRLSGHDAMLRLCGITSEYVILKHYIKPHGVRLADGRVIAWGRARDWKAIQFAVFERAFQRDGWRPFAAILLWPVGKARESSHRALIEESARRLRIEKLVWFDD